MDPMIDFVRHRTSDLQRVADDVRRERHVRPAAMPAQAERPSTRSPTTSIAPRRVDPCPPCDPVRPEPTVPRAA